MASRLIAFDTPSQTVGASPGEVREPRRVSPTARVSHNLNGQRLGKKGRDTRERVLAAANEIIAEPDGMQISLSGVARRASLGMTSLYNYFTDLTELLLALLEPVMATAEETYVHLLRDRWPDGEIESRASQFVAAYHAFWVRHSRLLHLRNSMADRRDERMLLYRVRAAQPLMQLLIRQMSHADDVSPFATSMATALMTGLERVVTVTTDDVMQDMLHVRFSATHGLLLTAEARLLSLAIRDCRTSQASQDPQAG